MQENTYLNWVISHTKTMWWHDSAELAWGGSASA